MKSTIGKLIRAGVGAAIVGSLLVACSATSAEEVATPEPVYEASTLVSVTGVLVPESWVAFGPAAGGTVAEVMVAEGASVEAGQVLLRLDDARQAAAVAQAESAVAAAEARLDQVKAGARPQEIDAAEVAVDAAAARLARLREGATDQEVAVAWAAVVAAQASLQQVQEGPSEFERIAAEASLANAQASLQQAQAAYDLVKASPDVGALPQSAALQQATNAYNAAKASYDQLQAGPTEGALAVARAAVGQAQAELARVQAPVSESDIAAAEAEVHAAQARLDLLLAGATTEEIAVAEAEVGAARAGLQAAEAALAETRVLSPMGGTVVQVGAKVGEQILAGQAVFTIADLGSLLVETTDLNEIDVVRLRVGDEAVVTFDAISGLSVPGTIARIPERSSGTSGVNYTVVVEMATLPAELRWGMTAFVDFEVSR